MLCWMIITLLWTSFGGSRALKCYTCSSDAVSNCGDPFYTETIDMPTCHNDLDQGICTKTKTSEGVVSRGCGLKSYCKDSVTGGENTCKETLGTTRCCCYGDGCNSAPSRGVDYPFLAVVTLLGMVPYVFP
ncbi:uncharacterized protein LOC110982399 [Acanthaster planci]|uniref:Uncharacterized protein LOC110982399 n=1 Tax=Acanthaster planci TaxID=133434 RepID=A0A8B7YZ20_ACAPL|nr:uncharacterized protein LOC110982399 [Acanthaster planci]